jgi:phage major head subunit gpT-like protein
MPQPAQNTIISDRAVIGMILQDLERQSATSWTGRLANNFESVQRTETYGGVGNVPAVREWVGEKVKESLKEYSITITNKDWESTLQIHRKDLARDKTGQLQLRIGQLATRAAQHDEKLLSTLINTGDAATNGLAFSGQFFFDTDHALNNSGTINNDVSYNVATTTAPTSTEAANAMMYAIQQMYGFKDDQGEPTNQGAKSFSVMVPVTFWAAFQQAVNTQFLANGVTNPIMGHGLNINLIPNARLTWTEAFAVFIDDQPTKPFIIQTEEAPRVEVLSEGSDYAFNNASHLYSVVKSGNVGYGDFTKAILCTLT